MSPEVQDDVVSLAERMLDASRSNELSVTWFGGEPLLAPGVVESLSQRLMALMRDRGSYKASIITNGYLLTQKNIDMLARCKVDSAPATLVRSVLVDKHLGSLHHVQELIALRLVRRQMQLDLPAERLLQLATEVEVAIPKVDARQQVHHQVDVEARVCPAARERAKDPRSRHAPLLEDRGGDLAYDLRRHRIVDAELVATAVKRVRLDKLEGVSALLRHRPHAFAHQRNLFRAPRVDLHAHLDRKATRAAQVFHDLVERLSWTVDHHTYALYATVGEHFLHALVEQPTIRNDCGTQTGTMLGRDRSQRARVMFLITLGA